MDTYVHVEDHGDCKIEARLMIGAETCTETIEKVTPDQERQMIWQADFPRKSLGQADGAAYLRVMTGSIMEAAVRAQRLNMTLAQAVAG